MNQSKKHNEAIFEGTDVVKMESKQLFLTKNNLLICA